MSTEDEFLLKWQCIIFFQNNPHIIETAIGVARSIGREVEPVQQTLNNLVEINILLKQGEPNHEVYQYLEAFSAIDINLI
jgi:hypothetical protein